MQIHVDLSLAGSFGEDIGGRLPAEIHCNRVVRWRKRSHFTARPHCVRRPLCVSVCVCVCVREIERKREREKRECVREISLRNVMS